jgi:hypothetical protein
MFNQIACWGFCLGQPASGRIFFVPKERSQGKKGFANSEFDPTQDPLTDQS